MSIGTDSSAAIFSFGTCLGADQTSGAIAVGEVVQEGQTVQFHLRDAESASEDLNVLLAADRAAPSASSSWRAHLQLLWARSRAVRQTAP